MVNPKLLLLDEPFEGLAPRMVQELAVTLHDITRDNEMAIVLVEQHARLALSLTERAMVLDRGRVVYRGDSKDLLVDPVALHRLLAIS
jgi:branched-chain amino acid transport system ATP-binding protein